jgi:hypothetical protein
MFAAFKRCDMYVGRTLYWMHDFNSLRENLQVRIFPFASTKPFNSLISEELYRLFR